MSRPPFKWTVPVQLVLSVLAEDPGRELYGLEIIEATSLASGTVYPIIARLEEAGWIEGRWEIPGAAPEGRARRHYYSITGAGVAGFAEALARAYGPSRRPFPVWLPRLGGAS